MSGLHVVNTTRKLWIGLILLMISGLSVLLWMGGVIHQQAPPMPARVVSASGQVLYTPAEFEQGRQVWQSFGGQQIGSVRGHGALVAPDWSVDWLHRRAEAMLDLAALASAGANYASLPACAQARQQAMSARHEPMP